MAPPVMRLTSAARSAWPMIAWAAPCARASSAFSSVETTPITVAPRCFAHWHRISPTPPAAACTTMVSPGFTAIGAADQVLRGHALQHHRGGGLEVDRVGQLHQPVGGDHPLGRVGAERRRHRRPGRPAVTSVTSGPTAATVPAPSMPSVTGMAGAL